MKFNSKSGRVRTISCALTLLMLGAVVTNSTGELALTSNEIESSQSSQNAASVTSSCTSIATSLSSVEYPNYNYNCIEKEENEPVETYLMYVDGSSVRYRSIPVINDTTIVGTLNSGEKVDVVSEFGEWCKCVIDDEIVYIHADLLTEEYMPKKNAISLVYTEIKDEGIALTSTLGRISGPSGEETYYNRNMNGCIKRMKSLGYDYEYWVREDGVKMYGDYIMVAANFDIRPLGTLVETSLGTGIVVDCGDFVEYNPTGLDLAVTW